MSTRYARDRSDSYALIPLSEELLDEVSVQARASRRGRAIVRLHEHDESVQRMVNAIEPGSYIRPHRHPGADKHEALVVLRGSVLAVRFDATGAAVEGYVASASGTVRGVEMPAGSWHTVVALESGTVLFEVNSGPYDAGTHKEFAEWAPLEEDQEAALDYLLRLRAHFGAVIPALAARDAVEAEEDEIL